MPKKSALLNANKLVRVPRRQLAGTPEQGAPPNLLHQITAEAAHDLNNALGSIRLYLDLLETECGDAARVRHRLRQIKPVIEHAVDLTHTLLGVDARTTKPTSPGP